MSLKARIAISVYLALAILFFLAYGTLGFSNSGYFAAYGNWASLIQALTFGAGTAIIPTGLVMLGVWSNSWFKEGIARRAARRQQKYSGN